MLTTTLIKKHMAAFCVVALAFSLAGCNLPSVKDKPDSTEEQALFVEEAERDMSLSPVREDNSNYSSDASQPSSVNFPNGADDQTMPMEREATEKEDTFPPSEWLFDIRQPKKQLNIAEDEVNTVEKIEVTHLLAGKIYEYTFSSSEEIIAILKWYKSLELKTATFSEGEQTPNMKEGGSETYTIYYKVGTEKNIVYYGGSDEYIWMLTDDIWYEITN